MSEGIDSLLAYEILSYLLENPDAQDTLEGIVEWWMLERKINRQAAEASEVLADLVARGFVLEQTGGDSRTHYRINHDRTVEIRLLLKGHAPKSEA